LNSSVSRKNEMMVAGKVIQAVVEESDEHAVQWLASMCGENSV
jgi:hypothetical protein